MISRRSTLRAMGAGALALVTPLARAQNGGPPIRLLVGLPPGTSTDAAARLVADKLSAQLGRTVVVENKPGVGERLALLELRRSEPNGNTLLLATSGPFCVYPHIYKKLDYDPVKDFTPIAGVATFDVGLSTGPMTGAKDIKELIAWIRAHPEEAVYGTPGNGTLSHFVGIAFSIGLAQKMTPVPYKDGNVAVGDVAAGRLPMHITGMSTTIEMHRSGRIHIVATSGNKRSPLLPDVPTLQEAGINVSGSATIGIFGPPNMTTQRVAVVRDAFLKGFHGDDIASKLGIHGITPEPVGTEALTNALAGEYKRVGMLAEASGYVPE